MNPNNQRQGLANFLRQVKVKHELSVPHRRIDHITLQLDSRRQPQWLLVSRPILTIARSKSIIFLAGNTPVLIRVDAFKKAFTKSLGKFFRRQKAIRILIPFFKRVAPWPLRPPG